MAEPPPPPPGVGPLPQAPLTGTSPTGVGVMGNSQTGPGVLGQSFGPIPGQTGAANDGVYGVGMNGVHGVSAFATGIGVLGEGGFNGIGVSGVSSGTGAGVKGFNDSAATPQATSNAGVWGESQNANGVYEISHSSQYAGVSANNDAGGLGVEGQSTSGVGVYGQTSGSGAAIAGGPGLMVAGVSGQNLSSGYGVWGSSASGDGVFGQGGKNGVHGETASPNDCAVYGHNSAAAGGTAGCGVGGQSSNSDGVYGQGGKNGVHGKSASPNDSGVWGHNSAPKGSKGYGVSGTSDQNIGVYGSGGQFAGWFEGDVTVTGTLNVAGNVEVTGTLDVKGDITMPAADFAEDFPVDASGGIEPGNVMVLDQNGVLRLSDKSYDRKVVGVISGAGDYRPGIILDRHKPSLGQLPLALVGKVYCKVDAIYGRIEVGDLLTTSPTAGHAMKADNPVMAFGAVIGKALRSLKSGCGLIPILISLQ